MTVCAAFLVWANWFTTTSESLQVCLTRRNLPESSMLPSQLRYLSYLDSLLQQNHLSAEPLRLTRLTITHLPLSTPYIEIFNNNALVFSSYRKGSRSHGVIASYAEGETAVFKIDTVLKGNVFIRLRHLKENQTPTTLCRMQFHTSFIKLFKLELSERELDASVRYE